MLSNRSLSSSKFSAPRKWLVANLLVASLFIISFLIALSSLTLSANETQSMLAPKASQSLLLDVEQLSSGRLVSVGQRGHVLLSDDQAENWRQVQVPSRETLTAVDFFDDKLGVAVGFEQTILLTTDGGESWSLSHYQKDSINNPALFDVLFINQQRLIAIGAYGLYFESNDGGKNWQSREVAELADIYEGFSHFYGIDKNNSGKLFLAGEKYVASEDEDGVEASTGLLAVSSDQGATWQKLSSPYDGSFFGIKSDSKANLYAYGLKGHLFISSDQGQSWADYKLNTNSGIHDLIFTEQGWFAVGTSGVLIDGANKKIEQRDDLKGRAALAALADSQLVIVGEGGVELFSPENPVSEQALEPQQ